MPAFTWDVDPILVRFPDSWSGLPVEGLRYYSLLYVAAFLGGYKLLDWQLRRAGGDVEDAHDFVLYGVIAVVAGARLGHVAFYEWQRFLDDPAWVLQVHRGGLSSHGALLGLVLAMFAYTRRRRQSFVEGCDRLAFSAALGAVLIRIGNLLNSEIVGKLTGGDYGVRFPRYDGAGAPLRHPTQLYEAVLGAAVLAALLLADARLGKERRPRGALISLFLALYFGGRFLVEFWKEVPPSETAAGLSTGQWLSIAPALLGCWGWYRSRTRPVAARWDGISAAVSAPGNARQTHGRNAGDI